MHKTIFVNLQKELIREVEMGPFKHTVDDGLDIRKVFFHLVILLILYKCIFIEAQ